MAYHWVKEPDEKSCGAPGGNEEEPTEIARVAKANGARLIIEDKWD
jgi:hypothetical protein